MPVLINILEEGLIYGLMAMGVYITYRVLSFPDLTVDGSFPLGGCATAALLLAGVDPLTALAIAFVCGCFAGLLTGVLHVRLGITDLLSGILTMTALWSINLVVAGGKAVVPFYQQVTIFSAPLVKALPAALYGRRVLIELFLIAALVKLALDWFFRTKTGLLLRAAGDNAQFASALAVNPGTMKILGLMLGNGLTALSGAVLAQQAGSANVASGTGMVVMGLASVIIGLNLFGRVRPLRDTTRVVLGAVVYKACLALAMQLGLPANFLKLLMSALFVVALMSGRFMGGRGKRHA
ncbi:MAG: ABC transporter permease [Clostridiales bacterium]|nr:ABC transporter permease [Clostridiales bacterium]